MSTNPIETGHGAPDTTGLDVGFGEPDGQGGPGGDTGFGSPSVATGAAVLGGVVADEGGEIVALVGDFTAWAGPYIVTVEGGGLVRRVYGAAQGRGRFCYPNAARNRLEFAAPPMPPGTYNVRVVGAGEELLTGALTYVRRYHCSSVHRFRALFPRELMPAGPSSLRDESAPLIAEPTKTARAEAVKAVAQEINALIGVRHTRLTAALVPDATTAQVESTYTFPQAGTVYVEGLVFPRLEYTAKTDTTLTLATREVAERETAPLYAAVALAEAPSNALHEAWADCLLARAQGPMLEELAASVADVTRAGGWMDDATLADLAMAVAWVDAGPWLAVWKVVEAWTRPFAITNTTQVSGAVITDTGADFKAHHVGRYVRVWDGESSQIHRVEARTATTLTLAGKAGPYWTAADYPTGNRRWELLPFLVERDADEGGTLAGAIRVLLAAPSLWAPATYLQEHPEADYAAVTPPSLTATGVDLEQEPGAAGDNYRGFVLDDADEDGTALDPDVPVYVWDSNVPHLRALLEDVVPAWCRVEFGSLPA